MACKNCQSNWRPRGDGMPTGIDAWYARVTSDVYADSGIWSHLPVLRELAENVDRIVELGVGGMDQSTIAFLAAKPTSLDSFDINQPGAYPMVVKLAKEIGVEFEFHEGDIRQAQPILSDLLFIDSLHTAEQVAIELAAFAPLCTRWIVGHDVVSFGNRGQCDLADQGINLAFARFLFENKEWRVSQYYDYDNGLLVLERS